MSRSAERFLSRAAKSDSYFNYICVRSFVLNGAPFFLIQSLDCDAAYFRGVLLSSTAAEKLAFRCPGFVDAFVPGMGLRPGITSTRSALMLADIRGIVGDHRAVERLLGIGHAYLSAVMLRFPHSIAAASPAVRPPLSSATASSDDQRDQATARCVPRNSGRRPRVTP